MNSTPDIFDEWFEETHNGTGEVEIESDVDEIVQDFPFDDLPSR